jgi:hypothetical protein
MRPHGRLLLRAALDGLPSIAALAGRLERRAKVKMSPLHAQKYEACDHGDQDHNGGDTHGSRLWRGAAASAAGPASARLPIPSASPLCLLQAIDFGGGRDRDRTCDPYDVNVVLSR